MDSLNKDQLNENINNMLQNIQEQQPMNDAGISDIKYQNLITNALVKAGLPENKLNTLIELVKDKITCNSECQKERSLQEFKEKMEKIQNDFNNYETNLENSEKKYYELQGIAGKNKYNELLNERQAKKTAVFINTQTTIHKEIKEELNTLINTLNANKINYQTLNDFLEIKIKEKEDLKKKIENYKKIVQTADRKVVYEMEDLNTSRFYRKLLLFIFYLLLILYFIFSDFFPSEKYKFFNTWAIISLYIVFPYSIDYIINFFSIFLNLYSS